MTNEVKDFINRLLDRNPLTRLGSTFADVKEVISHQWFVDINFSDLK